MTTRTFLVVMILLVAFALGAGCSTVRVGHGIDPEANGILKEMGTTLANAGRFSFDVRTTVDEELGGGAMVQRAGRGSVRVSRPDRIFATKRGDRGNRDFWYEGSNLTIFDRDKKIYASVKAPSTIDKMLDFAIDEYDLAIPLADILFSDPYRVLVENVESGEYVGVHKVGGRPCHHLAFHQELIDWQIWIDEGKIPLPRKVIITYLDSPERPQYEARFSAWDLSPKFTKGFFEFTPPPGAERVDMDVLLGHEEVE